MMRPHPIRRIGMTALGAAALACVPASAHDGMKEVELRTADGRGAGTATFTQARRGVIITFDFRNLSPGPHGLHLHETGACTPDFKAAGGHYNPLDSEHGFDTEGGYHVGDLPNISVGADGTARGDIFVPQVTLMGPENDRYPFTLQDADGSAIMVHARADDYRNMASSGERAACGVIIPTSE